MPKSDKGDVSNLIPSSQCLKIAQKVAFNIASEASYIYILSGQKLVKNAKSVQFWRFFENLNSVTWQVNFNRTKNSGKWDFLQDFQTFVKNELKLKSWFF